MPPQPNQKRTLYFQIPSPLSEAGRRARPEAHAAVSEAGDSGRDRGRRSEPPEAAYQAVEDGERRGRRARPEAHAAAFAETCLSLTPKVSVHEEASARELFLEISGTTHLFGGEAEILLLAENLAAPFALTKKTVLIDRPEWARACAIAPEVFLAAGKSQAYLFSLPIERIAYCGDPATLGEEAPARADLVAFMKRVGMRLVGDFARLSYIAVGRRFGKKGVELQEWVQGVRELLLPPFLPEASLEESLDAEEITSLDGLLFLLRQGLLRLEGRMRGRQRAARQLRLRFELESRATLEKFLDLTEPLQDAQALLKLLHEFLSRMQWDSPLEKLVLAVTDAVPTTPGQLSLFDKTENRFADLAQYVARLRARYGEKAVGFPLLQESYLPERSWKNVWPPPVATAAALPPPGLRPLFLFMPARPCAEPRDCQLIPSENLAGEWWDEDEAETGSRRYFIAESPRGERLWVYWDGKKQEWFVQGTFD